MKYILGSGLVAMLAKHILQGDYQIIPHNKSRFYTKDINTDNFLVYNDKMKPMLKDLGLLKSETVYKYENAWSYDGEILKEHNDDLAEIWGTKIFGLNSPSHFKHTLKTRLSLEVFDCRLSSLYDLLYEKYSGSFYRSKVDKIESVSSNEVVFDDHTVAHDGVITTYPIYDTDTPEDLTVVSGNSKMLDFEGNNQLWVVDPEILFFKVTNIRSDGTYNFMFSGDHKDSISSIRYVVPDFRPISCKVIKKAIPKGERITTSPQNIVPIGATAENDYAVDMSTSILRLLNYASGV